MLRGRAEADRKKKKTGKKLQKTKESLKEGKIRMKKKFGAGATHQNQHERSADAPRWQNWQSPPTEGKPFPRKKEKTRRKKEKSAGERRQAPSRRSTVEEKTQIKKTLESASHAEKKSGQILSASYQGRKEGLK